MSPPRDKGGPQGNRYDQEFRDRVAKYAKKHGIRPTAREFDVSPYIVHKWLHAAGYKAKPVGAPVVHGRYSKAKGYKR